MSFLAKVVGNLVVLGFASYGAYKAGDKVFGWYVKAQMPSHQTVEAAR